MKRLRNAAASPMVAAFAAILLVVVGAVAYFTFAQSAPIATTQVSSTATTSSGLQGVATGLVTVGPSQPVCRANQTCNVDLTGYSLVFVPRCGLPASSCPARMAAISPSGHYSILLPAGNYTIEGLSPPCKWMGCASNFPREVTVVGGMQIVLNFEIDTGIR